MKYKCIVFDYDNTIVASMPNAQFDALTYACDATGIRRYTKDQFLKIDSNGRIGDEIEQKFPEKSGEFCSMFYEYLDKNPPSVYDGMKELMDSYRSIGGIICIVSNSTSDTVKKGMEFNKLPKPDAVYGWEAGEKYRKPNTTALYEISSVFGISQKDMMVVDDKPDGIRMGRSFGTECCISGWGIFDDDAKKRIMAEFPDAKCFDDIRELKSVIFA